jgi:hypothetical protein
VAHESVESDLRALGKYDLADEWVAKYLHNTPEEQERWLRLFGPAAQRRYRRQTVASVTLGVLVVLGIAVVIAWPKIDPPSASTLVSTACQDYVDYVIDSSSNSNTEIQDASNSASSAAKADSRWTGLASDLQTIASRSAAIASAAGADDPAAYAGMNLRDDPAGDARVTLTCGKTVQRDQAALGDHPIQVFESPESVSAGSEVVVKTQYANATSCNLEVVLPYGHLSAASGLGTATPDANGNSAWTWTIDDATTPGTAQAVVSCTASEDPVVGADTSVFSFQIN